MKLLTQKILNALPLLYATEEISFKEKLVICKFFLPGTRWSWYVFEGEATKYPNFGDVKFFGIVNGFSLDYGYFRLSEIRSVRNSLGLRAERDADVFKTPFRDLIISDNLGVNFK